MNEHEKYLFDLNGYIVVENVLTPDEVALCNEAIDHHSESIRERVGELSLSGGSDALEGITGRGDLGGMLGWEKPWCEPFRRYACPPQNRAVSSRHLGKRIPNGPQSRLDYYA